MSGLYAGSELTRQKQLSVRSGMSAGRISDLLSGKKAWYLDDVARVCEALGADFEKTLNVIAALKVQIEAVGGRRLTQDDVAPAALDPGEQAGQQGSEGFDNA
jgi:transcriptional regulator with XRE-family HTH domain